MRSRLVNTQISRDATLVAALMIVVVTGFWLAACSESADPSGQRSEPVSPAAATQGASQEQPAEMIEMGEELYSANCQSCHGDRNGEGGTGLAPPHNDTGHTWHHPDAQLKERIFNGTIGFGQMPTFKDKLVDEEVDAILSYIKTWWTIEQQADQADISKRYQDALDRQKKGQ